MVKWPWSKEKRDATGIVEGEASQRRKEEAFTRIEGTEHLSNRIRYMDESLTAMINHIVEQISQLLTQKEGKEGLSADDEKRLDRLNKQLFSFEVYRAGKKSGVAWSASGENRDMSERWAAFEQYFSRYWSNPGDADIIFRMASYLADISFCEWHVQPAPTVMIDKPVIVSRGYGGMDPNTAGAEASVKRETVARDKH